MSRAALRTPELPDESYRIDGVSEFSHREAKYKKRERRAWVPLSTKEMLIQHERLLRDLHRKKREARYDSEREIIQKKIEGKERFIQKLWGDFAAVKP